MYSNKNKRILLFFTKYCKIYYAFTMKYYTVHID